MTTVRQGVATFLLATAGFLLLQSAWMVALPAYWGQDEMDHAFRADAVIHGDWRPSQHRLPGQRGTLVSVREALAGPALEICRHKVGPQSPDCRATADGPTRVFVPSGAARYDPAPYLLIGLAGRPFSGLTALYAMRVAVGFICSLGFGLAFVLVRRLERPNLLTAAVLAILTPLTAQSAATAAPNGFELVSALIAWLSALVVVSELRRGRTLTPWIVWTLAAALSALAICHGLGVLWAGVSITLVALTRQVRGLASGLWSQRRAWVAPAGTAVVVILFALGWANFSHANDMTGMLGSDQYTPLRALAVQPALWMAQSVVSQVAWTPVWVLLLAWSSWVWVTVSGLRGASVRTRKVVLITAVLWLVIPLTLSAVSWVSVHGFAWQGRYSLPLLMGVLLLAASGAPGPEQRRDTSGWSVGVTFIAALLLTWSGIALWQSPAVLAVASPGFGTPHPIWLSSIGCAGLSLLVAAGVGLPTHRARRAASRADPDAAPPHAVIPSVHSRRAGH